MRVRDGVLVLLAGGPAHGYQLKLEYERLTRNAPVNVGQIYQTLERLQRDGLVEREEVPRDERRVTYHVTDAGRARARELLLDARDLPTGGRSAVAAKVLLAATVPNVDLIEVIDVHRDALLRAVQAARHEARGRDMDRTERLVLEAELAITEAELRWLDLCEAEIQGGS